MFYDVIVIGAGLSGLMAADAAESEGARVLLLARGMGSLPLTTGCIDALAYLPGSTQGDDDSPLALIDRLGTYNPLHPYIKAGKEKILGALSRFRELCRAGELEYGGDLSSTVLLPTSLGTFHPTCLVPETMKGGDLSRPDPVLILGFKGLRDFFPSLAAENLNALKGRGKTSSSFRAEALDPGFSGIAVNALNLARAFDEVEFRNSFAARAKPLLKKGERLGLPAVLGVRSTKEAWEGVQQKLGSEIFEIPMPPPSVPGMRIYNVLRDHLRERGVRIVMGFPALTPLSEPGRILGFSMGTSGNSPVYRAKSFVLATGKFFGGGMDSDRERVFETLLGLPVRHPRNRKEWFNSRLLTPEGQPFNSFGVEVDDELRPVDFSGKVVFQNLFAAGGILSHADFMAEKSGGGVAISTGHWAGKLAAKAN